MIKSRFSEKLKELRSSKKYTQKIVASILGVSPRVYAYWESGKFPSHANIIIKICKLYGIDADELLSINTLYEYSDNDFYGE